MQQTITVPINSVRPNPSALRNVNRESQEYIEMVDSVRSVGIMNNINVTEKRDPVTSDIYYEIVDGLHRFSCAKDCGLTELEVKVLTLNEAEVYVAQLIGNLKRIPTTNGEIGTHLRRIMTTNPLMTEAELAKLLCHSPKWVQDHLSLNKLDKQFRELVTSGDIKLTNAVMLAKLPVSEQPNYATQAQTMGVQEFNALVQGRVSEIRKATAAGRKANPATFSPVRHLRKLSEINSFLDDPSQIQNLISTNRISDPATAAKLAVQWVLNVDPAGIEAQLAKEEKRKADLEAAKKKREAEKAAKAAEKVVA